MPSYDANSYIAPIEVLLEASPQLLLRMISAILSSDDCDCTIIDYPSIVAARRGEQVIDIVAGQGSIVCNSGCKGLVRVLGEKLLYTLSSTSWVYGKKLKPSLKCATTQETYRLFKEMFKPLNEYIQWRIENFNELLKLVSTNTIKAFTLVLPEYDPLSFIQGKCCGKIYAPNPLIPGAAFIKKEKNCLPCVKVLGPLKKKIIPVISLEENPLIALYMGLGTLVLILIDMRENPLPPWILNALITMFVYECCTED